MNSNNIKVRFGDFNDFDAKSVLDFIDGLNSDHNIVVDCNRVSMALTRFEVSIITSN